MGFISTPQYVDFMRNSIGFDNLEALHRNLTESLNQNSSFPFYNLIRDEFSENTYLLQLALAGYSQEDISIEIEKGQLIITSDGKKEDASQVKQYVNRGFSIKPFKRVFTLMENVIVDGADFKNGVLTINLHKEIPESQKPRKIAIGITNTTPQMLNE